MSPSLRREREQTVVTLPQRVSNCIHNLIEDQVFLQPDASAIEAHDGHYTYSQAWAAALALSNRLTRYGSAPESRVAILMEKSIHYAISVLAVLRSGAAFVPLDASHPLQRLQQLYQEVEPSALITTSHLLPVAQQLSSRVLLVDADLSNGGPPQASATQSPGPDNAAYIIFTSGSTGKPKGVVIEHAAFVTSALARGKMTGLGPGSRVIQFAAHTFDVSVDEILTTLLHGGCVCVPSEGEKFDIGPAITKMRVNHALLTPTSAAMLHPESVPSLKTIQMGGELLSEEVNNKWTDHVRLFNVYGPTEASVASVMSERTGQKGAGHVIGLSAGSVCCVVDVDDHKQLVMPDAVGELVIGGHTLARGYLNDVTKTEAAFVDSPPWISWTKRDYPTRFYKTGDLASMDRSGSITIRGRKDNQIKLKGQRINVEEIEVALHRTELVHGVIVDLPKTGSLCNKLTAVVAEPSDIQDTSIDSNEPIQSWSSGARQMHDALISGLHAELQNIVPLTMIPLVWISVPHLPQNSSAKTDRMSVRTWLESLDASSLSSLYQVNSKPQPRDMVIAKDEREAAMELIWCRVLNISKDHLRPNRSFIRNGGDSITAMELRSLVHDLGIPLKISDILKADGIRALLDSSTRNVSTRFASEDSDTGKPFPLSPTQMFYFEATAEGTEIFTQSVCLEIKTGASSAKMRAAIGDLISRHPMLRARFSASKHDRVQWTTEYNDQDIFFDEQFLSQNLDLDLLVSDHVLCVSPSQGPVFHALLINRESRSPVISLVAHHLVVDFVSWRIILQDLENLLTGNKLLPTTLDYQTWCKLQSEWTATLDPANIPGSSPEANNNAFWTPDHGALENVYSNVEEVAFNLTAADTQTLLYDCADIHGARTVELILASLYKSFTDIFPDRNTPTLFIESHGREPWDPSIDISRTVGWFTTAYPIAVPFEHLKDMDTAIFHTKQRCRAFADNGHAYWCCRNLTKAGQENFGSDQAMEFVFNFSGRYQHLDRADSAFHRLGPIGKETAHPHAARLSIFDILVSVEEERLEFKVTFPKNIAYKTRVVDWIREWHRSLASVAAKCLPASLAAAHESSCSMETDPVYMIPDAQEVYPVSSLQQQMLHSQARNPFFYGVIGTWRVEIRGRGFQSYRQCLYRRWKQIVTRHANLRTVFVYSKSRKGHVGVVLKDDCSAIQDHFDSKISAQGHRLPHELILSQDNDGSLMMRLEISHTIIDAFSRDLLMQELFDEKEGNCTPSSSPSYSEYLQRIRADARQSSRPTDIDRCIFPTSVRNIVSGPEAVLQITVPRLRTTCDPFAVSRSMGVTFSSLVFTVWSLILSKYTACNRTSFAHTMSDRPRNMPHILQAVGCYIQLLTCIVEWEDHTSMFDIAHRIQVDYADVLSGDARGVDASQDLQNGHSGGSLNTMVNVRNAATGSDEVLCNVLPVMTHFEDPWDVSTPVLA